MYRNTKNNLLYFRFPPGFIPDHIEEKYNLLLKQYQSPFKSTREFINSLVIGVTFPSLSYENVQQAHARATRNFRGGTDVFRGIDKEFSIDLRLTEGYLSYFILYETIIWWNDDPEVTDEYLPNFLFKTLDLRGKEVATIEYKEILVNSIGELAVSFSEVDPSFNTFSVGFVSNLIDIKPFRRL